MSKKLESLKKLLDIVKNEDRLAGGEYCDNGRNCVIGHLLRLDDVTQEQLESLDNGHYGAMDYSIGSILDAIEEGNVTKEEDFVGNALSNLGFDMYEDRQLLKKLQNENDFEGQKAVISKIDLFIKELENNE